MLATTSMVYHLLFAETAEAAEALMVARRRRRLSSYSTLAEQNDSAEEKQERSSRKGRRKRNKRNKKDREERDDDKEDREDREDKPDREDSSERQRPERGDKPVSTLPVQPKEGDYDAYIAAVIDEEFDSADEKDCPKQGEQRRRLAKGDGKGKPKKGKPKADPCRAIEAQPACDGATKYAPDFKAVDADFDKEDCCDAVVEHTCVWVARPEKPERPEQPEEGHEGHRRLRGGRRGGRGGNRSSSGGSNRYSSDNGGGAKQNEEEAPEGEQPGKEQPGKEQPEEERPTHVCMSTKAQEKILLKEACLALGDEAACAADDRCEWFLPKEREEDHQPEPEHPDLVQPRISRRSMMEEDRPAKPAPQPRCLPKRPEDHDSLDEDEREAKRDERKQQAKQWLETCLPKQEEEEPEAGLGARARRWGRALFGGNKSYSRSAKGGEEEKDGGERKQKGGEKKKDGEDRKGFKVPDLDELIGTCDKSDDQVQLH